MLDLGIEIRIKETAETKFPKEKLVAVKGAPATGQAGGTVEIPDRPDTGDMDFTYNYSEANLTAVKTVCDNTAKDILIKYPDGTGALYTGICQTWKNEVSVGGVIECTLHTVPSTQIADKTSTEVTALIATE